MKKKVTYTVNKDTAEMFKSVAEQESLNMSKWLENQMIKYIEEKTK